MLKNHFEKLGYKISLDDKLTKGHYSPFVINIGDKKVALEYATPRIQLKKILQIEEYYTEKNIILQWIIIDSTPYHEFEKDLCCIKRHLLHSDYHNNSFIQFNIETSLLNNCKLNTIRRNKIFEQQKIPFDHLLLNEVNLSTKDFDKNYSLWVDAYNLKPCPTKSNTPLPKKQEPAFSTQKQSSLTVKPNTSNKQNTISIFEFFSLTSKNGISKEEGQKILKRIENNTITAVELQHLKAGTYHLLKK